ncbi:hypothetical protein ANCDUO_10250 [Ancylostoma duodenale]|uniref:Uncharacterized protein n=1 Tax=Ancylostoma duodenale TaxID=51022 RepID=A0A0C2GKU6_9BILA|nr:hypothetical protein ANCDUO_10250 [Ancylostoma duodenale]
MQSSQHKVRRSRELRVLEMADLPPATDNPPPRKLSRGRGVLSALGGKHYARDSCFTLTTDSEQLLSISHCQRRSLSPSPYGSQTVLNQWQVGKYGGVRLIQEKNLLKSINDWISRSFRAVAKGRVTGVRVATSLVAGARSLGHQNGVPVGGDRLRGGSGEYLEIPVSML